MKLHRSLLSLITAILLSLPLSAQVVPVYSVASPEAAGLGEYGTVPVSLFTGVPNISVPLHEAKFGKHSIPISADYHLGAVRPNDPPGCLGLGWTLVADGVISRSVRGVCDEKRSYGATIGNGYFWHTADMHEVVEDNSRFDQKTRDDMRSEGSDDSWYELSADEFSFSFLGYSGNFYLSDNGDWTVVSDQDIKVEFNPSTGFASCSDLTTRIPGINTWHNRSNHDCFFIEFTLITPDGVRYTFGGVDATDFSIPYYSRNSGEIIATAWHLKRITTPEGYTVTYSYLNSISDESIMVDIRYVPGTSYLVSPPYTFNPEYVTSINRGRSAFTGYLLYSVQLNSIITPNERISFEYHQDLRYNDIYANQSGEALYWEREYDGRPYGSERANRYAMNHEDPANQFRALFPNFSGSAPAEIRKNIANKLRSYFLYRITIDCQHIGGQDKSIFFSYTYNNRRKVDRIAWRPGIEPLEPSYTEGAGILVPIFPIPENTSGVDMPEYRFTYDNRTLPRGFVFPRADRWGYYNGTSWSPADPWPIPEMPQTNPYAAWSETLKEVTYPTGGSSVYEYERNQYARSIPSPGQAPQSHPGFAGGLRVRSIRNYDRTGSLLGTTRYHYTTALGSNTSSGILSPDFPHTLTYSGTFQGAPLSLVLQSESGFPPPVTRMNAPAVGYSTVIEEHIDAEGTSNGYIAYHFSNYGTDIFGQSHDDQTATRAFNVVTSGTGIPYTSLSAERGHLLRKDYHAGSGALVRREDTHYARVREGSLLTAVQRFILFCADPQNLITANVGWLTSTPTFSYLPVSTEVTQYDYPSSLTTREETDYNSSRLPVEKRTMIEDGRTRVQRMTYAVDSPEYSWLANAHLITPLASTTTIQDGTSRTISQHLSNASATGRAMPYPDLIQQSSSEHPQSWTVYEALSADQYGNPTEIVEKGRHSFLQWGVQGQVLTERREGQLTTRYGYNGNLQLTSETRPDNLTTGYDYDELGRLCEVSFTQAGDAGLAESGITRRYEYHLYNGTENGDVPEQSRSRARIPGPIISPPIDAPETYHPETGYAYEIPLTWRTDWLNEEPQYKAILVADDTLTVAIKIPQLACDEDVIEMSAPSMVTSAKLWRMDGDDLVLFCELPFHVDMASLQCAPPDGRDSIGVVLPPDSYVLEYRGLEHGMVSRPSMAGATTASTMDSGIHLSSSTAHFLLECLPLIYTGPAPPTSWNSITELVSRDGSEENVMRTKSYKDDLGRDYAVHQIGAGPGGETLVSLQEYDDWGRKSRTWLPAVTDLGGWHAEAQDIKALAVASHDGDPAPFSFPVYEDSPLGRVVENYGPGEDWTENGRAVRTAYLTNNAGTPELSCLRVSADIRADGAGCTISSAGPFATGNLAVVYSADEDEQQSYVFTDRLGRTVLSRQILASAGQTAEETLLDTYYAYDGMDRLVAVIPPAISTMLRGGATLTQADIDRHAYLYSYDSRGRMCARKVPGADWVRLVYDGADRVLFEQDGRMAQEGKAVCHLYDVHGRECVSLTCSRTLSTGETFDGIPYVSYDGAGGTFGAYSFEGTGVVLADIQVLALNYYDDYAFETDFQTGLPGMASQRADVNAAPAGLLTGGWCAEMEGGELNGEGVWTSIRYDRRGRPVHSESAWTQGGYQTEDIILDFLGSPLERHLTHVHHDGADTVTETLTYTYDHQGRLLTQTHSLNGGDPVVIQDNGYDQMGRLASIGRGTSLTEERSYDVRSQLTSISSDLFSENIHYNVPRSDLSIPRFNGTISAIEWTTGADSGMRAYDFSYDALGRLTEARYSDGASGLFANAFGASYAYDCQGNAVAISRRYSDGGTARWLDRLSLAYDGSHLVSVEDAETAGHAGTMEFRDGIHLTEEYGYDANGNTVFDLNSGLNSISYDITDHPAVISSSDGTVATFSYLASGVKTRMAVETGSGSAVTEYRGNLVWKDGQLAYILLDGGIIDCRASDRQYVFYFKDHLGNNRVAASADGDILQVNHYYPFGLSFKDTSAASATDQPWRFGGKELLSDAALDIYDFEARLYNPALGRFLQTDPMADKYYGISPYLYCAGNPVLYVDPTGKIFETLWDIANVAMDAKSLVSNIKAGNLKGALLDGAGMTLDAASVLLPGIPGGAGTALKAARTADKVADATLTTVKNSDRVSEVAKAANAVHGNSKLSTKAQHAYDIIDRETGKIAKTGVSGGQVRLDGKSVRAETQVRKWNKEENTDKYYSVITHTEEAGPGARDKILKYEKDRANYIRDNNLGITNLGKHVYP